MLMGFDVVRGSVKIDEKNIRRCRNEGIGR
jgi:hypothetical protein